MFDMAIATQNQNLRRFRIILSAIPVVVAGLMAGLLMFVPRAEAADEKGQVSGLPIPRFVSLKSDRVNVRGGPTKDHEVTWVFTRTGLPVEVTAEFENWRRIRDWEGAEGWVYHSLLSGRRTGIVTARSPDETVALKDDPEMEADVIARLQPGVIANIRSCNGSWCRVSGPRFDGWIPQERLWGVYPNEKLD